ncbi:polysaccharide deacetylase family protein [Propionivibrio limicola]|uniref:polysaccharide deacetylase family protein n=1 Tax=Propionivibrio limicola TaxID=167645 RepID=UPI001291B126|nr:polysaccharide deacetylase family protein [Propionivibrio limicola]
MRRIALKIDVDTFQGTALGVPKLLELLQRHNAKASFFFSLGPDHSGRESRSESLVRFHGLSTRLYGRFLPGPAIGTRCATILRSTQEAGFEAGIHAWDRAKWEKRIQTADNTWVEAAMCQACARFEEIFSVPAKSHAAAGWRMNRHALRLTQRLGFAYASDCRGDHPFIPVIDGEIVTCPQLPTTLPTIDEILVLEPGFSPDQAVDRLFQLSNAIASDHVFTLRAELEGLQFFSSFERLITTWVDNGFQLVALEEIAATLDKKTLPRHTVVFSEHPGRKGLRLTQGPLFLQA